MTTTEQPDTSAGYDDPDYFLLREFEAQKDALDARVQKLRGSVLDKVVAEHQRLTALLRELKAERKRLNMTVKEMEAKGNTSIVAQSDFIAIVKPLAALEGRIAELEVEQDALTECKRQLKLDKRRAAAIARAVNGALRQLNKPA